MTWVEEPFDVDPSDIPMAGLGEWVTTELISQPLKGIYKHYQGTTIDNDSAYIGLRNRLEMINENPNEKIVNVLTLENRWIIITETFEEGEI